MSSRPSAPAPPNLKRTLSDPRAPEPKRPWTRGEVEGGDVDEYANEDEVLSDALVAAIAKSTVKYDESDYLAYLVPERRLPGEDGRLQPLVAHLRVKSGAYMQSSLRMPGRTNDLVYAYCYAVKGDLWVEYFWNALSSTGFNSEAEKKVGAGLGRLVLRVAVDYAVSRGLLDPETAKVRLSARRDAVQRYRTGYGLRETENSWGSSVPMGAPLTRLLEATSNWTLFPLRDGERAGLAGKYVETSEPRHFRNESSSDAESDAE